MRIVCDEAWLVDDNEVDNFVNRKLLENAVFSKKLFSFESPEKALNLLEERINIGESLPEWLFLDIHMPHMNGFTFLEKLRKFREKNHINFPKIVILSALIDEEEKQRSFSLGGDCFISKPLKTADIEEIRNQVTS